MGLVGADPLAVLRRQPDHAAVLLDFDGTLAPIVERAGDARPLPGAREVLVALQEAYAVVAVISGRPVAYLTKHLGSGLRLVGLYGLEWTSGGDRFEHAEAAEWRPVIDALAAEASRVLPAGVDVEHKGLSLTLHLRPAPPSAAVVVQAWAADAARRTGTKQRAAKMSVELHPPIAADKGTVVAELLRGLTAAAYLGDDQGDLPAFAALDSFRSAGGHATKIAIAGIDATPALVAAADIVVDGPPAALTLLRTLI